MITRGRGLRTVQITAGLLVCLAAGALSSIALARSGSSGASAAYYYYCPGGGAGGVYGYCPPTTTTTTTTTPPPSPGFMTGGGQIDPVDCTKATFGGNASGVPGVSAKGHFNYINHCTGVHVNGPVTEIIDVDPVLMRMTFKVQVSSTCTAIVTWRDGGEPGSTDTFAIEFTGSCLPAQTSGDVTLDRGNIQWHSNVRRS